MEKQNPFKLIGMPPQDVPPELRKKVMKDINTAKLLMDMASLFTSNYSATLKSLFKTNKTEN